MTHVEPPKEGESMSATSPVCNIYKMKKTITKEKKRWRSGCNAPAAVTPKGREITKK